MTLSTQFYTMLSMIGMGALFGAALDTYSRFLNRSERKRWLVFINDIMFWVLQALAIFYILFVVNFGEIRFYIFLALLCGFAGYQALIKQHYLGFLERLIQFFIALYNFAVKMVKKLIYSPIKWMIVLLITIVLSIGKGLLSVILFLLKVIWKLVQWAIKLVITPIGWILKGIWNLLPKNLTKRVEKLYNKMAGNIKVYIKKVYRVAEKFKKKPKDKE
ncbi:spore cortex biosynthesis protein YabQ [Rossellomorea aquimaris]|uniref:spore cortex biosynthesis protein YabQ n=1 Tax=Rossellomorea aquimaris TaxID=189382 RepID=UPI001CD2FF84|nr:spore cortex biosynthesis protein YabQ [Rossellomorea aquimaris]MCA1061726.1 spore cortex biosynthesis protein YabQ [Rossellomorea aquimaris]